MSILGRTWTAATVALLCSVTALAAGTTTKKKPPAGSRTPPSTTTSTPDVAPAAPAPSEPVHLDMPPPPPPPVVKAAPPPPPKPAEPPPPPPRAAGPGWSAHGPQGLDGEGQAVSIEAGFPGLSLNYLRPMTSTVDLAVHLDGNYAYEGLPSTIVLGGRGEVGLRLRMLEIAGVSVGLHAGVGALGYFPLNGFVLGVALPVGVGIGLPVGPTLAVSASLELPMWIAFGAAGGFSVPVMGNLGLEYFIDKNLAATLRAQVGPAFNPTGFRFGGPSELAAHVYGGVELRL